VEFTEEVDSEKIISAFNENSTENIQLLEVVRIDKEFDKNNKKTPQSMAAVDGAEYTIKIKYKVSSKIEDELKRMLKAEVWNILKKSKSGEKEVNIKPMVKKFKYIIENNTLIVNTLVACGSRENLSAELLAEYIKKNTDNVDEDAFTDIKRVDMFGLRNNEMIPLWQYFQQYSLRSQR
jgi:radical SAM-linked protein